MDFTEEELEFRIRDMEEELEKVKSTEEESKRLKDREEKALIIAIGKSEKVEQMMITKKDQVSLGSKESDMDQYMDLDEKRLIKKREKKKREKNCWSRERLEAMPGLGIGFCLVTVLLYQCMNIITKKMTTHPFVILFLRDCLLTPQVKTDEETIRCVFYVFFPFAVFPSAYIWQDNTFSQRQDVAFSSEVRWDNSDTISR